MAGSMDPRRVEKTAGHWEISMVGWLVAKRVARLAE